MSFENKTWERARGVSVLYDSTLIVVFFTVSLVNKTREREVVEFL